MLSLALIALLAPELAVPQDRRPVRVVEVRRKLKPVEEFRRDVGYRDSSDWSSFDVTRSVVSETRRRLYFEKQAVTDALLAHAGGSGRDAAPMSYRPGTVFVAERVGEAGETLETEVLVIRERGLPRFVLYGRDGFESDRFPAPGEGGSPGGSVPRACISCHAGTDYFSPTMDFPTEDAERRIDLPPRARDSKIVLRFLEGFHRGDALFAPYGSIWLSLLKADHLDGTLAREDVRFFNALRVRYGDLLDPTDEEPPVR